MPSKGLMIAGKITSGLLKGYTAGQKRKRDKEDELELLLKKFELESTLREEEFEREKPFKLFDKYVDWRKLQKEEGLNDAQIAELKQKVKESEEMLPAKKKAKAAEAALDTETAGVRTAQAAGMRGEESRLETVFEEQTPVRATADSAAVINSQNLMKQGDTRSMLLDGVSSKVRSMTPDQQAEYMSTIDAKGKKAGKDQPTPMEKGKWIIQTTTPSKDGTPPLYKTQEESLNAYYKVYPDQQPDRSKPERGTLGTQTGMGGGAAPPPAEAPADGVERIPGENIPPTLDEAAQLAFDSGAIKDVSMEDWARWYKTTVDEVQKALARVTKGK